jgi:DNA-binding MarR family transcriptional regulator
MSAKRNPAATPFRLDDQIGHVLRQAYRSASSHFARRLRDFDIKPQQFATLARLAEMGPTSQNCLGDAVGMPRANIHAMVQRLAAKGLVDTQPDPEDSRRRIVVLTEGGEAMLRELVPLDLQSTEDALAPLSSAERKTLYALLQRLCDNDADTLNASG